MFKSFYIISEKIVSLTLSINCLSVITVLYFEKLLSNKNTVKKYVIIVIIPIPLFSSYHVLPKILIGYIRVNQCFRVLQINIFLVFIC